MKKFVAGIIIGAAVATTGSVFAEEIKQYILTPAAYPIVVNGTEYADPAAPILNYEGSTYVPLAKLGDLTGVNYKWNETLKRVEIDTGSKPALTGSGSNANEPIKATPGGNITLTPDTVIEDPKGLVEENGEIVFYAYDKDGNYKGRFNNWDDDAYDAYPEDGKIPPSLSEGWLQGGLLEEIYGYYVDYDKDKITIVITTSRATQPKPIELLRLPMPSDWRANDTGETVVNGVRVKRFDNINYFYIDDLRKIGFIG